MAHSTKGTPSPRYGGSDRPEAHGFRISFTPLHGVLFTVPSRYWCTIGRHQYLALGCGHPCFPPDSACPAVLTFCPQVPYRFTYGILTLSDWLFQYHSAHNSSPVHTQECVPERRTTPMQQRFLPRTLSWVWAPPGSLAATTGIFSFPRGTLDVSVPPVPPACLCRSVICRQMGLPHSDSLGSPVASSSPRHFAAWPRPSSAGGAKASTMCSSLTMSP